MCISPKTMTVRGLTVEVACRKCWQCTENRRNDWVGRCIAESKTASAVTVVHLTYGGDDKVTGEKTDLGASILIYSDVKKWLKRLRHGHLVDGVLRPYPLRYIAVGEYGALKGRSHWHVVCFWQNGSPPFVSGKRNWADEWWPHGFTMTEGIREGEGTEEQALRYVLKYIQKTDQTEQSVVRMSKAPPLGADYFRQRARAHARQGLLPQDGFYSFPEVRLPDGMPRQFLMSGATLDYFMREFVREWERLYGQHPLDTAHSPFLLDWLDRQASRVSSDSLERRSKGRRPSIPPPAGYGPFWLDQRLNSYATDPEDLVGPRLYWSFDEEGYPAWRDVVVTETAAAAARNARSLTSFSAEQYRSGSGGS